VDLRTWREEQGRSRQWVADQLGTDPASVFRWELARGEPHKRIPNPAYMDKIWRLTGGLVDANSFYQLERCEAEEPPLPLGLPPARSPEGAAALLDVAA
jgi:hypothetical protein